MQNQPTMADFQEAQLLMGGGVAAPARAAAPAYTDESGLPKASNPLADLNKQTDTQIAHRLKTEAAESSGAPGNYAFNPSVPPPPAVPLIATAPNAGESYESQQEAKRKLEEALKAAAERGGKK
jgi:hypothetical protein